ncbi:MAG: hypothetical protein JSV21_00015 [Nitrospirota bacterium]|nr:MAG: hypothetical protein JSV21_00015 [Nitrospirota bacterium]
MIIKEINKSASLSINCVRLLGILLMSVVFVFAVVGCSHGPSETPQQFVFKYLQKKLPMVDISLADFYIKTEQSSVIDRVTTSIDNKKSHGQLDNFKKASYDLSLVNIEVQGKKDLYVDDESKTFYKIKIDGDYKVTKNEETYSGKIDEFIVIIASGNKWKVTETIDPWK